MLKIKQVVEIDTELPAPDLIEMTWIDPAFDYSIFRKVNQVTLNGELYQVQESWLNRYPDSLSHQFYKVNVEFSVKLSKIRVGSK